MSQHLTSILLYPTAVASYACNTALVSRSSLLDDKWGCLTSVSCTSEGILNSTCKSSGDQEFQSSKVQTRYQANQTLAVVRPTGVYLLNFFCSDVQFDLLLNSYLCFISFLYLDLYVLGDDALIS